jgi:hypothetical protein
MARHRLPRHRGFYLFGTRIASRERIDRWAQALIVGIGVCPRCGGPMTARCGTAGPYFHCLCHDRPPTILLFSEPEA